MTLCANPRGTPSRGGPRGTRRALPGPGGRTLTLRWPGVHGHGAGTAGGGPGRVVVRGAGADESQGRAAVSRSRGRRGALRPEGGGPVSGTAASRSVPVRRAGDASGLTGGRVHAARRSAPPAGSPETGPRHGGAVRSAPLPVPTPCALGVRPVVRERVPRAGVPDAPSGVRGEAACRQLWPSGRAGGVRERRLPRWSICRGRGAVHQSYVRQGGSGHMPPVGNSAGFASGGRRPVLPPHNSGKLRCRHGDTDRPATGCRRAPAPGVPGR